MGHTWAIFLVGGDKQSPKAPYCRGALAECLPMGQLPCSASAQTIADLLLHGLPHEWNLSVDFPHQLVGVEERFHGRSGNFCYNRVPTSCAVWRLVCPPRNTPKCAAEFRQLLIRDRMALLRPPLFRELDLLDELRRVVLLVDLDVEVSALPDSDVHELAGWTGRRVRAGTHHQGRPREDQRGAVEEPEMLRPSLRSNGLETQAIAVGRASYSSRERSGELNGVLLPRYNWEQAIKHFTSGAFIMDSRGIFDNPE